MTNEGSILKVVNVSKQYRLGLVGVETLSDDLKRWWYKVRGKEDPFLGIGQTNDTTTAGESKYVWALKDINFDVKQGEVLGIIGKNGAGKSTLLKILSRVTSPTTGEIKTKGKIASLLEVGTGFHPELTGRENIFLNGAILGMTKKEIKGKINEIVSFSGCERYIDTPVKRYSSGMRVRLAFAVAAHLEPEILVIDEVLAVGDAEFQKKAIGKMQDISAGEGRTILFVSHNMAAVKSLCTRCIVLEYGKVAFEGKTDEAVSYYIKGGSAFQNNLEFDEEEYNNNYCNLKSISLKNINKSLTDPLTSEQAIELRTEFELKSNEPERYHLTFHLLNELGDTLFAFSNVNSGVKLKTGSNRLICKFPEHFFNLGEFYLSFFLIEDKRHYVLRQKEIISFMVIEGSRNIGEYMGKKPGFISPKFEWSSTNGMTS